ncbi:Peptidoglycan L-alanyl-D-glutamate endopeptidase CwlK precursor [Acinetobacter pittii]|uniref:M15 family metallopeptidase n=1 Tax=Acinetobacter pittii TaxID=48296 RepID=UPI000DE71C06|nr:M15 family metallopeptidase [Acinetobacter pittii]SSP30268.1 Peptidoglycan L-alanyl-D-glutamate endopeptidase CwlK precursor [Acinetobacter pittii]
MSFKLGKRSLSNLEGVHPDLIKVVKRAIELTECDFTITEGLRTKERQAQLLKEKKTTTSNSRHLTGHAVDLAAWVDNTISWDWKYYHQIADAMKKAASELKVSIEWGGEWKRFPDGPHFELTWSKYPK